MELENFTIYLLVNDKVCNWSENQELIHHGVLHANNCHSNVNGNFFPACNIWDYISDSYKLFQVSKRVKHWGITESLYHSSFLLCNKPENVEQAALQVNYRKNPMAFLTYDYKFEFNWKIFTALMKKYPDWKFANNYESNDDTGIHPKGYVFSEGLHRRYKDPFINPLKRLIGSGIYGLWEKWDRIKFSQSGLRSGEPETTAGVRRGMIEYSGALSFDNSGTPWLFAGQALVWLGSSIIFILECTLTIAPANILSIAWAHAKTGYEFVTLTGQACVQIARFWLHVLFFKLQIFFNVLTLGLGQCANFFRPG